MCLTPKKRVYVNPDLTPAEREKEKKLRDELRTRRDAGEKNLRIRNGAIVTVVQQDSEKGKKQLKKGIPTEAATKTPETEDPGTRTQESEVFTITDPYEMFRYHQKELPPVCTPHSTRVTMVPVLKKRPSSSRKSSIKSVVKRGLSRDRNDVAGKGNVYDRLRVEVVNPQPLSDWNSIREQLNQKVSQAIYYPEDAGDVYRRNLKISLLKESAALNRYKEIRHRQLEMENRCMKQTKKSRENLLLRRSQFLPHIYQSGREVTKIKLQRYIEPRDFPATALFVEAMDPGRNKRDIKWQMTKKQLGYDVETDWVGCPEVTDEIRREVMRSVIYPMSHAKTNVNTIACGPTDEKEPPQVAGLGVVGQKCNSEILRRVHDESSRTKRSISSKRNRRHSETLVSDATRSDNESENYQKCIIDTRVSLEIADVKLSYSTNDKGERVIELGCTADIGTSAVNWISMKNTGTAAIHFNWAKRGKTDAFELRKLDQIRVIFDASGGVILPSEVYRLPFMYKAITGGYYSEDWLLLTEPVLENGAPVVLRLWGFSREFDPYSMARAKIKEILKTNTIHTICRSNVDKIVDYLPLKETTLNETRFPTIYGGPDLFVINNPFLTYHSASVFRLGKLDSMVKAECGRADRDLSVDKTDYELEDASSDTTISDILGSKDKTDKSKKNDKPKKMSNESSLSLDSSHDVMIKRIWEAISPDNILMEFDNTLSEASTLHSRSYAMDKNDKLEDKNNRSGDQSKRKLQIRGQEAPGKVPKPQKQTKTVTNIVYPSIVVNTMRNDLINCDANLPFQEAAFEVMSTLVDRLHFKTDTANGAWKLVVCRGLLAQSMEKFSEYASFLQHTCCVAERESRKAGYWTEEKGESIISEVPEDIDSIAEERIVPEERATFVQSIHSDEVSKMDSNLNRMSPESEDSEAFILNCETKLPRTGLDYKRYHDIYYTWLQIRMYQLLSEFCDELDFLLGGPRSLVVDWEKEGFTRVKQIPWNIDTKSLLVRPMPSPWIKIAQRIGATDTDIRNHRHRVEEMERAVKEEEEMALQRLRKSMKD